MKKALCFLILFVLLNPVALAQNETTNTTEKTTEETITYDDEDIIKVFNNTKMMEGDNYKGDSPLFENFMSNEFEGEHVIDISLRSVNDTIWCKMKDELKLVGLNLKELRYDDEEGRCEFVGYGTKNLDEDKILSISEARELGRDRQEAKQDKKIESLKDSNKTMKAFIIVLIITIFSIAGTYVANFILNKRMIFLRGRFT